MAARRYAEHQQHDHEEQGIGVEGFDGPLNSEPVYIRLNAGSALSNLYGTNPIQIDGRLARWSAGGLMLDIPSGTPDTVGPTRHWVNAPLIAEIIQKQPDPAPPNAAR